MCADKRNGHPLRGRVRAKRSTRQWATDKALGVSLGLVLAGIVLRSLFFGLPAEGIVKAVVDWAITLIGPVLLFWVLMFLGYWIRAADQLHTAELTEQLKAAELQRGPIINYNRTTNHNYFPQGTGLPNKTEQGLITPGHPDWKTRPDA